MPVRLGPVGPTGILPVDDSSAMTRQDARSTPQDPSRTGVGSLSYARRSLRITSFNPDQTLSTAHTLISTSPVGSATSRIVSSVMSVFTPEDFFGHETQITPSGRILVR